MESNKHAELVRLLIEQGHLKDDEIMPLIKIGTLRMFGGKETERDIFKPLGYLARNMSAGEPIYDCDIEKQLKTNIKTNY